MRRQTFDFTAIGLSLACLIHCLALPLLVPFLPLIGLISESEGVHLGLFLVVVPVSLIGLTRHKIPRYSLWALALVGILCLAFAILNWPFYEQETLMTVIGAGLLALAHLGNLFARHPASAR